MQKIKRLTMILLAAVMTILMAAPAFAITLPGSYDPGYHTRYTVNFYVRRENPDSNDSNAYVEYDSKIVYANETVRRPADPTRSGYEFTGWYTNSACTQKFSFSTKINRDYDLYAGWEADGNYYTISFNSNGGSRVDSIKVKENGVADEPDEPYRNGYEFTGWYTNSSCTNEYDWDRRVSKNMTLYAGWETEGRYDGRSGYYYITFKSNGGSSVERLKVRKNTYADQPDDPTRSGYRFDGWYTNSDCTKEFDWDKKITRDYTLYAGWNKRNSNTSGDNVILFETNGGSTVSRQYVDDGGVVEKPYAPRKEGYSFAGWYSDAALTKEYNFNKKVSRDMTLYAKWKKTSGGFSSNSGSVNNGGNMTVPTSLANIITKNFSNEFATLSYGTYGNLGRSVTLRSKTDISHLDARNLRVYVYNPSANQLVRLTEADAYKGLDGCLYFKTSYSGEFVVTDAPLAK